MKAVMKSVILFYFLSVSYLWALDMPKTVYRIADIDTARQEAADDQKPVCFIQSWAKVKPT